MADVNAINLPKNRIDILVCWIYSISYPSSSSTKGGLNMQITPAIPNMERVISRALNFSFRNIAPKIPVKIGIV